MPLKVIWLDKEKLIEIFEDLLENWYNSERFIVDFYCSYEREEELQEIELDYKNYKCEFYKALNIQ